MIDMASLYICSNGLLTMDNWKKLEVYRPLLPKEVSGSFKKFANSLLGKLIADNFKLKETNTVKRFYRFNAHVEQAIYFETLKSKTDFRIKIAVKPLFSDPGVPYWILEAFELSSDFKISYPLTQEYLLLAEHLIEKINKHLLPFFDKYQSFEKIVFQHEELLKHYHMTYGENNPGILPADHLIYDSSFRVRNLDLFNKYHTKFLNRELEIYERLKEDERNRLEISERIEQLDSLKEIILNDELYSQKIERQNENSKEYLVTFKVK
jgi:hypothetical protein